MKNQELLNKIEIKAKELLDMKPISMPHGGIIKLDNTSSYKAIMTLLEVVKLQQSMLADHKVDESNADVITLMLQGLADG